MFPFGREKLAREIDRACALAGIGDYGPHDLRRTYAALMHSAGAPIEEIHQQMGHASIEQTRD